MKKTIRLTESDLRRIVKRIIKEQVVKPDRSTMNSDTFNRDTSLKVNPSKLPQKTKQTKQLRDYVGFKFNPTIEGKKYNFTVEEAYFKYEPNVNGVFFVVVVNGGIISSNRKVTGFDTFNFFPEDENMFRAFTDVNLSKKVNDSFKNTFGVNGEKLTNDPTLNIKVAYQ